MTDRETKEIAVMSVRSRITRNNMKYFYPPLVKMRETQPFGVDWIGGGFYTKFGLKGHNGWDGKAYNGDDLFACFSGKAYTSSSPGYGNDLRIRNDELGLEATYGHLKSFDVKNGEEVEEGQLVGRADNTGMSTGPHLHFGLRRYYMGTDGSGPYWIARDNGYKGAIDPKPFFDPVIFKLPVELGYGIPPAMSVRKFAPHFFYFIKTTKRIPTFQEYKALVYGRWDLRTVLDPTMWELWSEITKCEYEQSSKLI